MIRPFRFAHLALAAAPLLATTPAAASAQPIPFFYPAAERGSVVATRDRRYGDADTTGLSMDVYRPTRTSGAVPALILFNVATGAQRANPFYASWATAAAANGLVAIVPDLRAGHADEDFRKLVAHLIDRAGDYGIDPNALAVYAGSGNVFTAFPIVEDSTLTAVKAAVMYYGTAPITKFRRDLPLLYVRAGLDRPSVNGGPTSGIVALAAQALAQNAPITVLNDPSGHHAFEMIDDDAATRDAIDRTIDFVKRATAPAYQAALLRSLGEATAAAAVTTRDFHAAAGAYRDLVAAHPDDIRLRLAYGESLLGDAQYAAACVEFDRLRDKGLGKRDLGLPAAEACLRNGDEDAAIAWLRTIPKQFLPASVQNDPVFAPLRNRPEFRALFDGDDSDATTQTPAPLLTVGGAFFALSVADMEASAKWYSEKLGLSVTMRVLRTATPGVTILEGGGLIVELVERADGVPLSTVAPAIKESNRVHGLFKAGFIVDDLDRAVTNLRARGVEIAMGPFPAHDGQRANVIIRDNAGNYLQLFAK